MLQYILYSRVQTRPELVFESTSPQLVDTYRGNIESMSEMAEDVEPCIQ